MYVIDASVFVADVRPQEPSHADARAFLGCVATAETVAFLPTIVLAEMAAAVSRGTGRPDLARRLIAALLRVPHYRLAPVDSELGNLAATLAAEHQIRGCDSIYVALARQQGATLITLDGQQLSRSPSDVIVRTPAQELAQLRQ